MSSDYQSVKQSLQGGADPAMLCATCPWDRNCVMPPTMSSAEIEAQMEDAKRQDEQNAAAAKAAGKDPGMPAGILLTALAYAGKDTSAQVCPVFALRLRSSGGRVIADRFKSLMQAWDDQS